MESRKLTILLVDDDEKTRQALLTALDAHECEVKATGSTAEAERLLKTEKFDMFIVSSLLNTLSGTDLIKSSKNSPYLPMGVTLGDIIHEDAFDCLPKHFTSTQLGHLLRKIDAIVELKSENERLKRIILPGLSEVKTLQEVERAHIESILAIAENRERAAEILGITTVTLWRKRKQYGLS